MRIQKRAKALVVAASVAGLVGLGGTAFTATGLSTSVSANQFVGGTVGQTVSGADLTNIAYTFTDGTKTSTNGAVLTFANTPDSTPVAATFTPDTGAPETATCGAVSGNASTCTLTTALSLKSVSIQVG